MRERPESAGIKLPHKIQVKNEPDYPDRTLFYRAKLYSSELKSGEDYSRGRQSRRAQFRDSKNERVRFHRRTDSQDLLGFEIR